MPIRPFAALPSRRLARAGAAALAAGALATAQAQATSAIFQIDDTPALPR